MSLSCRPTGRRSSSCASSTCQGFRVKTSPFLPRARRWLQRVFDVSRNVRVRTLMLVFSYHVSRYQPRNKMPVSRMARAIFFSRDVLVREPKAWRTVGTVAAGTSVLVASRSGGRGNAQVKQQRAAPRRSYKHFLPPGMRQRRCLRVRVPHVTDNQTAAYKTATQAIGKCRLQRIGRLGASCLLKAPRRWLQAGTPCIALWGRCTAL